MGEKNRHRTLNRFRFCGQLSKISLSSELALEPFDSGTRGEQSSGQVIDGLIDPDRTLSQAVFRQAPVEVGVTGDNTQRLGSAYAVGEYSFCLTTHIQDTTLL